MTYKLVVHKDFEKEWEELTTTTQTQLKKKLSKLLENPHIPKNRLKGDLAGFYKIKLLKAGVRLIYQVKDEQLIILLLAVGKRVDGEIYDTATQRVNTVL